MPKSLATIFAAFAVFALVVALYFPTLRGEFVYDSIAQVLYSDYIHAPSHWTDVLILRVVGQDELDRNRPLHLASLMLDAAIWGKNPHGYRLTSVLLHALNASLLFVFVTAVFARRTAVAGDGDATGNVAAASSPPAVFIASAFGALVFAFHPLVVEAVAEPSNREDLLVLLPMLIGLLCIAVPMRSQRAINAALVPSSFFAVLAKESGIAVPFVFAMACWLFRRDDFRKLAPGLIGGFAAAVGFLVASYIWRPIGSAIFAHPPAPLDDNFWIILGVQLRIWILQFWQIIWPWNLSAHYTADAIAGITLPVAIMVVAVVAVASVIASRAHLLAALGIAGYVFCLLPASNFAAQYHPIADRYLYVPLAGVGMLLAAMSTCLRIKNSSGFAGLFLAGLLLVPLCLEYAANVRRQFIWQYPSSLWTDVLRQYPRMSQALIGLANVHYRAGDFESARASATEAVVASRGQWADAWAVRAVCEWRAGATANARESFSRAVALSRIYNNEASIAAALLLSPDQQQDVKFIRQSSR